MIADERGIAFRGVESGTDRSRAHVNFHDQARGFSQAFSIFFQHHRKRAEFLSKRHRHGVLKLRAAHLDRVGKFVRFGGEGVAQFDHGVKQLIDGEVQRDLQCGRIDVISALRHVDVIQRVNDRITAARMPADLQGAVSDYFVGVHVG